MKHTKKLGMKTLFSLLVFLIFAGFICLRSFSSQTAAILTPEDPHYSPAITGSLTLFILRLRGSDEQRWKPDES
jgi:hypothetical protein